MAISFHYYQDRDFIGIEQLLLASYQWEIPLWGFSRHEFSRSVNTIWADVENNWRHTVGVWEENGSIISAVINEGTWPEESFFLFDKPERQNDNALLARMFHHAETHLSIMKEENETRERRLRIGLPASQDAVRSMAAERGYQKSNDTERALIMPFESKPYEVVLPEGYTISDGTSTPDFYLFNSHMYSFNYTPKAGENGEAGFRALRKMPGYRPELDLAVLDPEGKPVGMAVIWYHSGMPFCELEPLGAAWWCRRMGIARALIYEASNRVMQMASECHGIKGGDQQFYWDLGFEVKAEFDFWDWKKSF